MRPLAAVAVVAFVGSSDGCGGTTPGIAEPPNADDLGIYSETAPHLKLDQDVTLGTFSGLGGGVDDLREDQAFKSEGTGSERVTLRAQGDGFAGVFFSYGARDGNAYGNETVAVDISRFAGGSIRFQLRAGIKVLVGVRSTNVEAGTETSSEVLVPPSTATDAWRAICVPLADLTGAAPKADLTRMKVLFAISVNAATGGTNGPATLWFDNVRWNSQPC
ncbi:MAG TPA: hypothetical protein VGM50_02450 [Gemmatimonadaceae bacterium]|jgi:hypothetical protein